MGAWISLMSNERTLTHLIFCRHLQLLWNPECGRSTISWRHLLVHCSSPWPLTISLHLWRLLALKFFLPLFKNSPWALVWVNVGGIYRFHIYCWTLHWHTLYRDKLWFSSLTAVYWTKSEVVWRLYYCMARVYFSRITISGSLPWTRQLPKHSF